MVKGISFAARLFRPIVLRNWRVVLVSSVPSMAQAAIRDASALHREWLDVAL
jgi:hypothetical protein